MAIIDNLQKVVECKEEEGKLFIMVYPDTDKTILMNVFTNQYKTVLNGDLNLIKSVVDKASGQWECVGEMPLEYDINFDRFIDVKKTPMKAYMMISFEAAAKNPTLEALIYRLKHSGVVFGIKEDVLKNMLAAKIWETDTIVAEGIEPKEGRDGGIKIDVNFEKNTAPKLLDDGSVDYREISAFATVVKGDVLATLIPAEQGIPGKDIYGKEIPAKPRKEYELKSSGYVEVSEDGKNLVAAATGVLLNKNGILSVKENLELSEVDFNSGNIRFPGKITVKGNVNAGFVVESEGNILINGMVEGATIKSTGGSVQIRGGIVGRNTTTISAKEKVMISFAQDAKIECQNGTVEVQSYLRHCEVTCKDFLTVKDDASVIGGKIEAVDSIKLANCSNEDDVITELVLFDPMVRDLTNKRIKLAEAKAQFEKLYTPFEQDYRNKAMLVKRLGHRPGSTEHNNCEAARQKFETLKQNREVVDSQIKMIDEELAKITSKNGSISITGKGYGGMRIKIGKVNYAAKEEISGRKFYLDGPDIVSNILFRN